MRALRQAGLSKNSNNPKAKEEKYFKYSLLAFAIQLASASVFAGPEGGEVTGGTGSISTSGATTTIEQLSDRMSIDWQSYDVNANERVNYIQPDSSSISLNRILSNSGSQIQGQIDANGIVILMNPNGVFFGEGSTVNVGGLVASGLNIEASDFMNGDFAFSALENAEGKVINAGLINAATGGSVSLLGKQVENEGLIVANLGRVNLAAGEEAVLTFDGEGLMGLRVTQEVLQEELGMDAAVNNAGEIHAQGGQILLTASVSEDIFSQAVNINGEAKSVLVHEDGSFTLGGGADVVNSGELNVSAAEANNAGQVVIVGENINHSGAIAANGTGGNIEIHAADTLLVEGGAVSADNLNGQAGDIKLLGANVGLLANANITANGANGGGEILIGGDVTGANSHVRNAEFIYIGENALVQANAELQGDGGQIITFAENTARIFGELNALGGIEGGNGGFVETSGLRGFELGLAPSAGARSEEGLAGTWLIDPYNITISYETQSNISNPGAGIFEASGDDAVVNINTILSALQGISSLSNGVDVVISTSDPEGTESGLGDITLAVPITTSFFFSTGHTLTLDAHNDIVISDNASINASARSNDAGLSLDFNAGGNITIGDNVDIIVPDGTVNFDADNDIVINNNSTLSSAFNFEAASINLTADSDTVNSEVGAVAGGIFSMNSGSQITTTGSPIDIRAASMVIGTINTSGGNDQAGGNIFLSAHNGGISAAAFDTSGGDGQSFSFNPPGPGGPENRGMDGQAGGDIVIAASGGAVAISGAIDTSGGNGDFGSSNDNQQGRWGGDGGSLSVSVDGCTTNCISFAAITTSGGNADGDDSGDPGKGGDAGNVVLGAGTGNFIVSGSVSANGGLGVGDDAIYDRQPNGNVDTSTTLYNRGVGGNGGSVNLSGASVEIQNSSIIQANGGNGGLSDGNGEHEAGSGGNGGEIVVIGDDLDVVGLLLADGGNSGAFRTGDPSDVNSTGDGGDGGEIFLVGNSVELGADFGIAAGTSATGSANDGNDGSVGNASILLGGLDGFAELSYADGYSYNLTVTEFVDTDHATISYTTASGTQTLTGPTLNASADNDWQITDTNTGTLNTNITFTNIENLTGGGNADNFVLSGTGAVSGMIDGGVGGDSLSALDVNNTWRLGHDGDSTENQRFGQLFTDNNSDGTLDVGDTVYVNRFEDIETLAGGSAADTFIVSADGFSLDIEGGVGADTLIGDTQVHTFVNDGSEVINLSAANNTWVINAATTDSTLVSDTATNITFSGIESLSGGDGTDGFTLNDLNVVTGFLNGGSGDDTVTISNAVLPGGGGTLDLDVTLEATSTDTARLDLASIETFNSVDSASVNTELTLAYSPTIAGAEFNNWQLGDTGGGSVQYGYDTNDTSDTADDTYAQQTSFTNVNSVTGNGQNDIFEVTGDYNWQVSGGSAGSGELDSLQISLAAPTTWEIDGSNRVTWGTSNEVSFSEIEIARGDSTTAAQDIFNISVNGVTEVYGYGGDDDINITSSSVIALNVYGGTGEDSFEVNNGQNNTWTLDATNADSDVRWGSDLSSPDGDINFSDIETFVGGAGDDTFIVESISDSAAQQVSFSGGGNAGDSLQINIVEQQTWTLDGGTEQVAWATTGPDVSWLVSFTGIEDILGGSAADIFNISAASVSNVDGQGEADIYNINADNFDISVADTGGDGHDELHLGHTTASVWEVDDTPTVGWDTGGDSTLDNGITFSGVEILHGNSANTVVDEFTISSNAIAEVFGYGGDDIFELAGNVDLEVFGGDDSDTLRLTHSYVSTWNFDADTDTDDISWNDTTADRSVNFNNVEMLEGSTGRDVFNVDTPTTADIDGRDGDDDFNVNFAVTGNLTGGSGDDEFDMDAAVSGIIDGGANMDTLYAYAGISNTWSINATGTSGSVSDGTTTYATFESIENLSGGGDDSLDLSAITSNIAVSLGTLVITEASDIEISANGFSSVTGNYDAANPGTSPNATFIVNDGAATTWTVDDVNGGTVDYDGTINDVDFNNFNYLLAGDNSGDTFDISASLAGGIRGGAGDDIFNVSAAPVGILEGAGGNDTFNINSGLAATVYGGTSGADDGTADLLDLVSSEIATWTIDGGTEAVVSDSGDIQFSGIETARGGEAADTFNVSSEAVTNLEGGADNDIFNVNSGLAVNVFGGTQAGGDAGTDVLDLVSASTATWTIDGGTEQVISDSGDIQFSGIETARGGENVDTFNVSAATVTNLEGGADNDIFNISSSIAVNVFGGTSGGDAGSADVLDLVSSEIATWTIDGGTEQVISDSGDIQFSGIETARGGEAADTFDVSAETVANLEGGADNDIFNVGSGLAVIVYGGTLSTDDGTADVLDLVSTSTATWTLNGGTEAVVSDSGDIQFSGIETARGGEAADTFNVSAETVANLEGGADSDIFNVSSSLAVNVFGGTSGADDGTADLLDLVSSEIATWTMDGGTEQVISDSGDIQFSGIETARGGENVDTFNVSSETVANLEGGADNDIFNVGSGLTVIVYGGTSSTDDGTADLLDLVSTSTATWTLNGGTEAVVSDSGNIQFSGIETARGGEAADTFNVTTDTVADLQGDAGADIFNILAADLTLILSGGEGATDNDQLNAYTGAANYWQILGAENGVLSSGTTAPAVSDPQITFSEIESATGANEFVDTFVFSTTAATLALDAGNSSGSTNPVDIASYAGLSVSAGSPLVVAVGGSGVSNVESMQGASDPLYSTIQGSGSDDTIVIDGANSGSIGSTLFTAFGNVEALAGDDQITLESGGSLAGTLDTGANNDTITLASGATAAYTLNGGTGSDTFNINGTLSGTLNAGDGTDTLNINTDSTVSGAINGEGGEDDFNIASTVSGNLNGGAGNDDFDFESGADVTGTVDGGAGDDSFDINALDVSAVIAGAGQVASGDTLSLNHNGTNTWAISAAPQVSWVDGAATQTITFSGIENAQGGIGADSFNVSQATVTQLEGRDGSDTFNVTQSSLSIAYYGQDASTSADASVDNLFIVSPYTGASTWDITAGGNSFGLSAGGATSSFAGVEVISGSDSGDTFNIATSSLAQVNGGVGNDAFNIHNASVSTTISGGANADTAGDELDLAYSSNATWAVDGTASQGVSASGGGTVLFSGIETASGGSGEDTFNISASSLNFANGEGGNDSFNLQNSGIALTVDGGAGAADTLQTTHGSGATWTIDADPSLSHSGAVVNFSAVEIARGGAGADTFAVSAASVGTLEGYGGADEFTIATASLGITLRGGSTAEDTADDSLILSYSESTTWTIDGGTESLQPTDGGSSLQFSGFETATGGPGVDTFNVSASTLDRLNGGLGNDLFNIVSAVFSGVLFDGGADSDAIYETSANGTAWTLGASHTVDGGSGTNTFTGVESVYGSDGGGDTFTVSQAFTGNIDGRAGGDTFNVNAAVSGRLLGGEGDDIFNLAASVTRTGSETWDIAGGAGDDTFWLNNLNVVTAISGGSGSESAGDILWGFDGESEWTVAGNSDTSTIHSSSTGTAGNVSFSFTENLNGRNDVADTFNLSVVGASANIDIEAGGGSVIDTVDFSAVADNTLIDLASADLGGAERVVDDGGLILGSSSTAAWQIFDFDDTGSVADGVNDGEVTIGAASIEFVDFANIQGSTAQDSFELGDSGVLAGNLNGNGGGDTLTRSAGDTDWTITGTNTALISGVVGSITNVAVLQGGEGNDEFNFNNGASWAGTGYAIAGGDGAGVDSVISNSSSASDWTVSAAWAGSVSGWLGSFTEIEALNGSAAADTFIVSGQMQSIVGGSSATAAQYDEIVVNVSNPLVVWNINANNGGNIEVGNDETALTSLVGSFAGIENLSGGATNDTFVFDGSVSVSGLISGGAGDNILDQSGLVGVTWTVLGGVPYNEQALNGNTLNIDEDSFASGRIITGTNAGNGLVGPASDAVWWISTDNSGIQTVTVSWGLTEISYQNVGQIIGRNATSDTFNFSSTGFLNGSINGGSGAGTDTLNMPDISADLPWQITDSGTGEFSLNGITTNFTAVENANGGAGPDTFLIEASDASITDISIAINGGNGANTFTVNTGLNNALVGGSGVDTFYINAPIVGMVSGNGGADIFSIGTSAANLVLDAGGSNGDSLALDYDATASWVLNPGSWQVQDGDGTTNTITVFNFETLLGSNRADSVSFNDTGFTGVFSGRDGADVFTLVSDGLNFTLHGHDGSATDSANDSLVNSHGSDASWTVQSSGSNVQTASGTVNFTGIELVSGGTGEDTISTSVALVEIDGGGGNDNISLGADVANVNGDAGNDTIILLADTVSATIDGGAADTDTLQAADSSNTNLWLVSSAGAGSLNNTGAISFSNMENLTGGSGVDNFDINDALSGRVSGMGGDDVFALSAAVADGAFGGTGDDSFTVEANSFAQSLDGGVQSSDGAGDTFIYSVDDGTANTWVVTAEGVGTVTNDQAVSFTGMENIQGSSGADNFELQAAIASQIRGGDGANTYDFVNSGISTTVVGGVNADTIEVSHSDGGTWTNIPGTQEIVDGSATPGTITFSEVETFIAGNGEDVFNIGNATSRVETNGGNDWVTTSVAITNGVDLGEGNDTIQVTSANLSFEINGSDPNTANPSGGDTFIGYDAEAQWLVSGSNSGTYTNNNIDFITLTNIENLTGGDGNDTYTINSGAVLNGVIDGGGNTQQIANPNTPDFDNDIFGDEIIATALVGANTFVQEDTYSGGGHYSFANVERLSVTAQTGVGNYDTIQSGNGVNSWVINGSNRGILINEDTGATTYFTGFQNVQGGLGVDQFALMGNNSNYIDGQIHGGSGSAVDTIDYSLVDEAVTVQLGSESGGIADVEGVTGYREGTVGASHQRILIGVDGVNDSEISTWTISDFDGASVAADGINDGEFTRGGNTYQFTNFNTLIGHDNNDQFIISGTGRLTGGVIGGGGSNTLTASAMSGSFSVQVSNASVTDLSDVNPTDGIVQMSGVSTVVANGNFANTFYAANNTANVWQISAPDSGSLNGILFHNFGNLTGGNTQDTFTFTTATSLSGLIDGNGGSIDVVDATGLNDNQVVLVGTSIPDGVEPDLQIANVESILLDGSNNELVGDANNRTWALNGNNSGTLTLTGANTPDTSVMFSGFATLRGNSADDTFVVAGNNRLSGVVMGGNGDDSMDLSAITTSGDPLVVAVGSVAQSDADFTVSELENLIGSNSTESILRASNSENNWQITGVDTGTLNASLNFIDFASVVGGNNVDTFTFIAANGSEGELSGSLDGGSQPENTEDTVNMAALSVADVQLGGTDGMVNIERFVGNNTNSHFRSQNLGNSWLIDGENSGVLNDSVRFENFNYLYGGSDTDSFQVGSAGSVSGEVAAGAGADTLMLELTDTSNGMLIFNGGSESDEITLIGGSNALIAEFSPETLVSGESELKYSNDERNTEYSLLISSAEQIRDSATASRLIVNDTSGVDEITLNADSVVIDGFPLLYYSNKNSLEINASSNDEITVENTLSLSQQLSLRNATIHAGTNAQVDVNTLLLDSTGSVGSSTNRLSIDVTNLMIQSSSNPIYLQDNNQLNIAELTSSNIVDIVANGAITDSADLVMQGAESSLWLQSNTASVLLDNANAFGGSLSVVADEQVQINSTGRLSLSQLTAQNATLSAGGNIDAAGPVAVERALALEAAGNLVMTNDANQLGSVEIIRADNATIFDSDLLAIAEATVSGAFSTQSQGLLVNGAVVAESLNFNSGSAATTISGALSSNGNTLVEASGIDVLAAISGGSVVLDAGSGNVDQQAQISSLAGTLTITGNSISQNAELLSNSNIELLSNTGYQQNSAITATNAVNIQASGGSINMATNTLTNAASVNYTAANDMAIARINSSSLQLTAGGHVDVNTSITTASDSVIASRSFAMANNAEMSSAASLQLTTAANADLGSINAVESLSVSAGGNLTVNEDLQSNVLVISGDGNVQIDANLTGIQGLDIASNSGDVNVRASLTASAGDVSISADGDLSMLQSASINVTGENTLTLSSGDNLSVANLSAESGDIVLNSGGEVVDQTDESTIFGNSLVINATSGVRGVDSDSAFNADVASLWLNNYQNSVTFTNESDISVSHLGNNGDVMLRVLEGDIVLDNTEDNTYVGGDDPLVAGGVSNANFNIGNLTLFALGGRIIATGDYINTQPDIVAENATLLASQYGTPARALVYYVQNNLNIDAELLAGVSYGSGFYRNIRPNNINDQSNRRPGMFDNYSNGGEQLVEVEELVEIDPAIFTAVSNYFFDEVSIRLPSDQLYEDELEELEELASID